MLATLIIVPLILLFVFEFSTVMVYGSLLKNGEVEKYLNDFSPFEFNQFNNDILSPEIRSFEIKEMLHRLKHGKFIAKTPFSLTSKYYISGVGRVPRWSNSHREIERIYQELKNK